MRNACIILRKKVGVSEDGASAVLDVFHLGGYAFDEIRIVLQSDENRARAAILEMKKEFDNVLLLADKTALTVAKRYIDGAFSANCVQNSFGEAAIYSEKNKTLFLLSADITDTGAQYVEKVCIPFLQQKSGLRYEKIVLRAIGANDGRVDALLNEARRISGERMTYARLRKYDEDVIEITYDSNSPKMLVDDVLRLLAEGLGDTIYAMNESSLEEQVVALLKLRGKKISVAESFTGGGIAKRITSVSGASQVYFEGLNTYDELSKIKRLGVTEYTLKTLGTVSDQTAYEMAYGLLNTGDCDIAVATTGIAGPKSDRSLLPVGLCYIAVGTKNGVHTYRYVFPGEREEITETAMNTALFLAIKKLKTL